LVACFQKNLAAIVGRYTPLTANTDVEVSLVGGGLGNSHIANASAVVIPAAGNVHRISKGRERTRKSAAADDIYIGAVMMNEVELRIQIDGPDVFIPVGYLRGRVGQAVGNAHAVEVPLREQAKAIIQFNAAAQQDIPADIRIILSAIGSRGNTAAAFQDQMFSPAFSGIPRLVVIGRRVAILRIVLGIG